MKITDSIAFRAGLTLLPLGRQLISKRVVFLAQDVTRPVYPSRYRHPRARAALTPSCINPSRKEVAINSVALVLWGTIIGEGEGRQVGCHWSCVECRKRSGRVYPGLTHARAGTNSPINRGDKLTIAAWAVALEYIVSLENGSVEL